VQRGKRKGSQNVERKVLKRSDNKQIKSWLKNCITFHVYTVHLKCKGKKVKLSLYFIN
jgi:hypothetical protein